MGLCYGCWNATLHNQHASRYTICGKPSQPIHALPKESHGDAVVRIARYLKETMDMGLILRPSTKPILQMDLYADSDFAGLFGFKQGSD